jgi:SulP family sulfate permease
VAIILDFSRVPFVDVSAARAIETIIHDAHDTHIIVYETGMNDGVRRTLVNLNSLRQLPVDVTYTTRVEALRKAVDLIESMPVLTSEQTPSPAPLSTKH